MQNPEPLTYGNYFHIYNHGVGNRILFREPDNYEYFLDLYDAYISPVAETYAWCLMPNYFHLLVRMKEKAEVAATLNLSGLKPGQTNLPIAPYSNCFSGLGNCRYTGSVAALSALRRYPYAPGVLSRYENLGGLHCR